MEEARNRLNIVVLDACRNNPFARSFRSPSRGLASIDAPAGTLIAYATAPGRTASDGSGRNGLYTKELLAAMRSPGLKLEDVFKRTRAEVLRQSNNQQIPWEASSIVGDFYFSAERLPSTGAAAIIAPTRPEDTTTARMSVAGVPLTAMSFTTAQVNAQGQVVNQRREQCWGDVDDLGAGVKLEMVEIPAGEFLMGEDATVLAEFEMDCRRYWDKDTCAMSAKSETPQRRVRVNGFLMGKYEVTQRQWKAVMGSLPPAMNYLDAKSKGNDLPVMSVSWNEVQTFLQKLGRGYRLPSEAEWEYAARAGTRTAFAFGPTINPDVVNYSGGTPYGQAAKGVYRGRPVAVGSLGLANAWGLYDMHGNVWEWCEDNWHDSYN